MALPSCPECAASLEGMSSQELQAHRDSHWEGEIPFPHANKGAVERSSAMDEEISRRYIAEKQEAARQQLKRGDS